MAHNGVILWKKTSTIRSSGVGKEDRRRMAEYINSYLDETNKKRSGLTITSKGMPVPSKLKSSAQYLTKKRKGDVYICGFLRKLVVDYAGKPLDEMTNEEKAEAAETVWWHKLQEKNLTKIGHKIVASLAPEVCEKMRAAGLDIDAELLLIVDKMFRTYMGTFYPGHEEGYMLGIHHDKAHIHPHILLFPQTDQGLALNVSHWSKTKEIGADGKHIRKDFQGVLKKACEAAAMEMYRDKVLKQKPQPRGYGMDAQYGDCERLLSQHAVTVASILPGKDVTARSVPVREAMEAQPDEVLMPALKASMEYRDREFSKLSGMTKEELEARLARFQKMRKEDAAAVFAKASLPECQMPPRTRFSDDLTRVKGVVAGWHRLKWGSPAFSETSEGKWMLQRSKVDDYLGRWIGSAIKDTTTKFGHLDRSASLQGRDYVYACKREHTQRQLLELRSVAHHQQAHHAAQMAKVAAARNRRHESLKAWRVRTHILDLDITETQAALRKIEPPYIKQNRANTPVVVSLNRVKITPEDMEHARKAYLARKQGMPLPVHPNDLPEPVATETEEPAELPVPAKHIKGTASLEPVILNESPLTTLHKPVTPTEINQVLADELGISL